MNAPQAETASSRWTWLYKFAGAAALFGVAVTLGLLEAVTLIVARPALEMLYLGNQFAATEAELATFVAAEAALSAYAGLAAGVLMTVPSSVGTLGTYVTIASLLPWVVLSALVARRLFQPRHLERRTVPQRSLAPAFWWRFPDLTLSSFGFLLLGIFAGSTLDVKRQIRFHETASITG